MKKYVKPELFYESYELTQQIAACQYDSLGSHDDKGCTFTGVNDFNETVTIFLPGNELCTTESEYYCYHGSSGSYNIFNS